MFEEIVTKNGLKFNDLEKKIYKFVCMLGCFIIKYILENRDRKLMKARDSKKFRHKGYKNNCIKTIMGEVEYKRADLSMNWTLLDFFAALKNGEKTAEVLKRGEK